MFTQDAYVMGTITKDEEIKVKAAYHWIRWMWFYFMFATLGIAAMIAFSMAVASYLDAKIEAVVIFSVIGVCLGIYPFILYLSLHLTEMTCTNKRVVFKTGIISIKSEEIKTERIESIQINQSFWGRVFGFGNVCFSGTGTAKVEFFDVDNPWQIKAKIEEAVDESNKGRPRETN